MEVCIESRNETAKDTCIKAYEEEKRKVKKCIFKRKKEINEQFGRKMNEDEDVDGNRKVFWKVED